MFIRDLRQSEGRKVSFEDLGYRYVTVTELTNAESQNLIKSDYLQLAFGQLNCQASSCANLDSMLVYCCVSRLC